jgi:hypothetical protein
MREAMTSRIRLHDLAARGRLAAGSRAGTDDLLASTI